MPKTDKLYYDGSGRAYPPNPEILENWDKTWEYKGKFYILTGDDEHKEWKEVIKDSWTREEVKINLIYCVSNIAAQFGYCHSSAAMKEWNDATKTWIAENL